MQRFTRLSRFLALATMAIACSASIAAEDPATQPSLATWRAGLVNPPAEASGCRAAAAAAALRALKQEDDKVSLSPMCRYLHGCCKGGTDGSNKCCEGVLLHCKGEPA